MSPAPAAARSPGGLDARIEALEADVRRLRAELGALRARLDP
jgi:uncharacterized small protein (DUF1192 family)